MRTIFTILLACVINISICAQRPQFEYMMYGKSYLHVKAKYEDVGFKPMSMGMYFGHFSVVFLSPTPQFAAIGYKFDLDKCIIIELYLKSGNIRRIRRILNSDGKLTKLAKDVWISKTERIELKNQVGPAGKSLYLECTKL